MAERISHISSPELDATRLVRSVETIGRDRELATLDETFARHRAVALWGPPGVGKSHIARAHARSASRHATIDLAGVERPEIVERELAIVLGAEAGPQESLASLRTRLGELFAAYDPMVVVFDHVDGVPDIQPVLERLARSESAVKIIITSRSRLEVAGAPSIRIDGLGIDDGRALFLTRARSRRPNFDPSDVASIDRIVDLVDGLPLAIELAAARVRMMSPADIARRVEEKFDVLRTRGAAAPRHESLRAAFDESWASLDPEQRSVFAACAVFDDTFDLAAAERVIEPFIDAPVLDLLEELVDRSLVQSRFVDDSVRFELLRTVRDYARGKLNEFAFVEDLERARDKYLVERTEATARNVFGPQGARAFAELDSDRQRLYSLLDRLLREEHLGDAHRLLLALRWHIVFRGPLERYAPALMTVLVDAPQGASDTAIIAAIYAEALVLRGERTRAAELIERYGRTSDPRARLVVERVATMVEAQTGPNALCERLEQLVVDARALGDRFMQARALERLGLARTQANDVEGAWTALTEARELFESIGGSLFATSCSTGLGYVELRLGKVTEAIRWFHEAVDLYEESANHFLGASARFNLGVALHGAGEVEKARVQLEAALATWRRGGFTRYCAPGLVRLALVRCELGEDAARSDFSEAFRLANEGQDHHNAAIAYVERAAIDHSRERPVDFDELERMVPGIVPGADPDAFASALVLLVARAVLEDRAALPYVNRIEELTAMFSEREPYVRDVVCMLRDIARAWYCLASADDAPQEAERRQLVARAWEWAGRLLAEVSPKPVQNPYVRLWARRLRAFGDRFSGFAPLTDTFRAVLTVHRGGEWYGVNDSEPVDLSTRRPLRLLMRGLVESAQTGPTAGLDVDALAEAGWPGEKLDLSTRRNRVYTAVRFLREMDLENVLVTGDSGYRFADDVALCVTDEDLPVG